MATSAATEISLKRPVSYDADDDAEHTRAHKRQTVKPPVLNVVKRATDQMLLNGRSYQDHVLTTSWKDFNKRSAELIFGEYSTAVLKDSVATVQCLSGASSLRFGAQFLAKYYNKRVVYVPQLIWTTYKSYFLLAGMSVETYRYYSPENSVLDFKGLLTDIGSAAHGAIVFFHSCAHKSTMLHPSLDQWSQISSLMKKKKLLPFFDTTYQGFASCLEEDAESVRIFENNGCECVVAQSYSENMGLYPEPIGALSIVCKNPRIARWIESQMKPMISPMYSNLRSACVASTILNNSELCKEWTVELKELSDHIFCMRQKLFEVLQQRGTPGDWSHIVQQIGTSTFTGLSDKQLALITKDHDIPMTYAGRINMAALRTETLPNLVDAIHEAIICIN